MGAMLLNVDGTTSLSNTSMEKVAMAAPLDPRRFKPCCPDASPDVGVTGSPAMVCAAADDDGGGGGGGSSPPPRGAVISASTTTRRSFARSSSYIWG
jgi:hypothetical protein